MSWFKRAPRPKAPTHLTPKNFSPATERSLEESKLRGAKEESSDKKKVRQK